jgi:hypothetical protein
MDHAIIRYGIITETYLGLHGRWGFIVPDDGLKTRVFFHDGQRGIIVRGSYGFPLVMSIEELEPSAASPTIVLKNIPEVGARVAYYQGTNGKGLFARRWGLIPPSKTGNTIPSPILAKPAG